MPHDNFVEEVTPEARLQHVAAILAQGVLRHHKLRQRDGGSTCAEPSKSDSPGLEVPGEMSLTVPTG